MQRENSPYSGDSRPPSSLFRALGRNCTAQRTRNGLLDVEITNCRQNEEIYKQAGSNTRRHTLHARLAVSCSYRSRESLLVHKSHTRGSLTGLVFGLHCGGRADQTVLHLTARTRFPRYRILDRTSVFAVSIDLETRHCISTLRPNETITKQAGNSQRTRTTEFIASRSS